MMFGLSDTVKEKLNSVFRKHENVEFAVLYGSRAMGTNRDNSDIDLTLKGLVSFDELLKIEVEIDDLMLPYRVDLSIYSRLQNEELKNHIERVGIIFFKK